MIKKLINDFRLEFNGYNLTKFGKDAFAGLTVTAVALPLALAFGASSGASASAGLITAIIAGIIASVLSGASYQISGPTGAMTAVLLSLVARHHLQGLFLAGLIAGVVLIICGILKLGRLVYIIPAPVVTGFTSGISLTIALGQLDNILGVKSIGISPLSKLLHLFTSSPAINVTSTLITIGVVFFMILYPKKLSVFFPSSLAAITLLLILNIVFKFNVGGIGTIPATLLPNERLDVLSIDFSTISELILPAISIAALSMVESLLCGASAGALKGEKMDPDRELVAQGIANTIIPFFGGIPTTAAISRTSVAVKAGGQTRITGIINAIGIMLSMFLLGPLMSNIPLSALSGVLVVTAFRMNEWKNINYMFNRKFKGAICKFLITMMTTVVFDLTVAIALGLLFSALIFIVKCSNVDISVSDIDNSRSGIDNKNVFVPICNGTVIYISGPLFFLTAERLEKTFSQNFKSDFIIFSMRGVSMVDISAAGQFLRFCEEIKKANKTVAFSGLNQNVMDTFKRAGIVDLIGESRFFWSVDRILKSEQ